MPPAIPDKIPCESLPQLEQEIATLRDTLSIAETEETWDRIERALARFSAVVKGGGYKYEKELINGVKGSAAAIVSALNSERTRLSAAALDCLIIIAPRIGLAFEPLVPLFIPHILRLSTRTNKVYVTRSQAGLALILGYCHIPTIFPYLRTACKESKITTGRAVAVECVLRCLNKWDWTQKELKARVGDIEEVIRITGRDKDASIRQTSRKIFDAYKVLFPDRVDEFTGPFTPVMRKYLNIKPQTHTQKVLERARSPSREKSKRPPTKPDFAASTSALPSTNASNTRENFVSHVRSASSNAFTGGSSVSTMRSCSRPPDPASKTRSMPPPPSIPSRARDVSRLPSQQRPDADHQQSERRVEHERQRVLSNASSTFSVKSAPANGHTGYAHRPPVRLAVSPSHSKVESRHVAASSGQARRVPRVGGIEPHPANLPNPLAMTHKAPVRPTPLSGPRAAKQHHESGLEPGGSNAIGITFPSSEPCPAIVEPKRAQRVPKPPPASPPPKADRPTTAMSDGGKREVKHYVFRRGAPVVHVPAGKKDERKEGFAPRRGGGLTQPTLSQLNKQRTPASIGGATTVGGNRTSTSAPSKRPVRGAVIKSAAPKGVPVPRAENHTVTKTPRARHDGTTKTPLVEPRMIPLPMSPGSGDSISQALLLSPKALQRSEGETDETAHSDEVAILESLEAAEEAPEVQAEASEVPAETPEVPECLVASDTDAIEDLTKDSQEGRHHTDDPNDEDIQHVGTAEIVTPAPRTPPFPSADEESDEDELEAIEFTTRDAYDPAGKPIKTPRKLTNIAIGVPLPERSPLGEVVLNG